MTNLGVLDVEGTKYSLKLGETYLVGFKSNDYVHDIEINDTSVDVKHCILDFTERSPKLFDIKSKCGTFVDGMRVNACQMIPLVKSTTIQFGNVETALQLASELDSGFLEGRLSPPPKDDSEIICNSPENIAPSGTRLKNTLKNSITSTPNTTALTNNSMESTANPVPMFLVPTGVPRRSADSNKSGRSVDSFYIPETQYPVENNAESNNFTNTSFDKNKSKDRVSRGIDDDDFFIPETQEVAGVVGALPNYPLISFEYENVNETADDGNKIPSSQFVDFCTQVFNGSDGYLSDNSDDVLAAMPPGNIPQDNVPQDDIPCSIVISAIRHSPVQINNFLNDEEVEKEMSALQWSKKTSERSTRVDDIITPDIIQEVKDADGNNVSQCSTPDIFDNPGQPVDRDLNEKAAKSAGENDAPSEGIEMDFQPTQVFVKPLPMNRSNAKSPLPPCDKENIGPQKDLFLAPTQKFIAPPLKVKPIFTSPSPAAPAPPPQALLVADDEDLPPTQVFQRPVDVRPPTSFNNICLSSTLNDCGIQLTESSFKAKCNKLLDSDDDEMDEVIAPELVKKLRESLENPKEAQITPPRPATETTAQTPEVDKSSKAEEKEQSVVTPQNKFLVPTTTSKKSARHQPAISIDNFLYTPDFLGNEFSKDEQLQKLAELNWKNIISENQRKTLFSDEPSNEYLVCPESDDSQDSFNDLLPRKEERRKVTKSEAERPVAKKDKPKEIEEPAAEVEGRITRRRKSAFSEEIKEKVRRKTISESELNSDKKLKKENKAKKDVVSKIPKKKLEPISEKIEKAAYVESSKDSHEKKDESKESHSDKFYPPVPKLILRRVPKTNKHCDEDHKITEKQDKKKTGSHKCSKSKSSTKSTTRQSSKELDDNANQETNSKHHNETEEVLHNRSSSGKDKALVDHRNGFKQKKSEKNMTIDDESEKNELSKDAAKSKGHTKSSEKEKKSKKEDSKKKKESESKDTEVTPVRRLTRLRSGKDLTAVCDKETVVELESKKKSNHREKVDVETTREENGLPKNESNTKRGRPPKANSNLQGTTNQASAKNQTSNTNTANASTTTKTEKRKNKDQETSAKRLRSASPTDSVISIQSSQSSGSRRSQTQKIRIAVTMCDPRYQEILEGRSGKLWLYTKDPKDCDVLVVEKGNRTYKLMVAMARGIPIIKVDWLNEVFKKKTVDIPFEKYIYDDAQFQQRHQFSMKKSLHLARTTSLFMGIAFMITPGIRPTPEEMKDIIICAGGTVLEHIPKPQAGQQIYLVSLPSDKQHWYRFRRSNANIKIVTSEGVMASVMQQCESPLIKSIIE